MQTFYKPKAKIGLWWRRTKERKKRYWLTSVAMLSAIKFHDESMSKLYKPNPYKFDLKFLVSNFFYFSYHRFVNAEMICF